jgi:VanZ family protein
MTREAARRIDPVATPAKLDAPAHPRSWLPHTLALLYTLAIVYASLSPFAPWISPAPDTPFFLFAPPSRFVRFDFVQNVIAYVPLGFFVALMRERAAPPRRIAAGLLCGLVLSFAMETLQMWLPPRDASVSDLAANSLGALLGGALGAAFARARALRQAVSNTRASLFIGGHLGDIGVALLVVWLAAQINPGIPLFAVTYDPEPARALAPLIAGLDGVALAMEAAESALQLLGAGVFVALLMRERRHAGGAVLLLIGVALIIKGVAATLLLRPEVWQTWIRPGALVGIAIGALLLLAAIGLPRPLQIAICAVALLSSLLTPLLAPELLAARAPLALFEWHYGHLLHYNGLTRAILLAWPLAAAAWLFALAGQPGWGATRDT